MPKAPRSALNACYSSSALGVDFPRALFAIAIQALVHYEQVAVAARMRGGAERGVSSPFAGLMKHIHGVKPRHGDRSIRATHTVRAWAVPFQESDAISRNLIWPRSRVRAELECARRRVGLRAPHMRIRRVAVPFRRHDRPPTSRGIDYFFLRTLLLF